MQRIPLRRSLLNELLRCDRSFVMSLYYHNLDDEHLLHHEDVEVDAEDVDDRQRALLLELDHIAEFIDAAGTVTQVECQTNDIWEKVRETQELISQGGPLVIVDGALESDWLIVEFAAMIVREDGKWEVYHMSPSSFSIENAVDYNETIETALQSAAPLMTVLADKYSDKVARFAVVGPDKRYMTPYPDPKTGEITIDADDALYCFDISIHREDLADHLGTDNPAYLANELQSQVAADPTWIPEASTGPQCNKPYACPFKAYCKLNKDPDSVSFYIESYHDCRKLEDNGYYLMEDVVELSYIYPTLTNVPCTDDPDKTFDLSEKALRDLRMYESIKYGD